MNLSYQEKSIWGSLLALLVVFGSYFVSVDWLREPEAPDTKLDRIVGAVALVVLIEIVYHVLIALKSRAEPKDERDVLIAGRAYRNAYLLLTAGSFISIALFLGLTEAQRSGGQPMAAVDLLLAFVIAAEITKFVTQLIYYRWRLS